MNPTMHELWMYVGGDMAWFNIYDYIHQDQMHVNNVIIIVNNVNLRVFAVVANTAIFCMREIANNFVNNIVIRGNVDRTLPNVFLRMIRVQILMLLT